MMIKISRFMTVIRFQTNFPPAICRDEFSVKLSRRSTWTRIGCFVRISKKLIAQTQDCFVSYRPIAESMELSMFRKSTSQILERERGRAVGISHPPSAPMHMHFIIPVHHKLSSRRCIWMKCGSCSKKYFGNQRLPTPHVQI